MSSNALFYNAENGDRLYDADSFESLFQAFFRSGVAETAGGLLVTPVVGSMNVQVASGLANCNGKVGIFPSVQTLTLATAHSTLGRKDLIVVRRSDADRDITLAVKTGTPGGDAPTADTETFYELPLAVVTVTAGMVGLDSGSVQDMRQIITQAVPEDITQAVQAAFDEWFAGIQETMEGDTAANLANQTSALDTRLTTLEGRVDSLGQSSGSSSGSSGSASATLLGATSVQQIKAFSWTKADDRQDPGLIMTQQELEAHGVVPSRGDLLLVLFRLTYAETQQLLPVVLPYGGVATCYCFNNGNPWTRTVRWLKETYTVTYRKQTYTYKSKKYSIQKKATISAGLFVNWARSGTKAATQGDLYEAYAVGDTAGLPTAALCVKANNNNKTANFTYNSKLLPVGVWLLTGANDTVEA